mmetsp:Transcript_23152/g.42490  ORF Transcript_23152/g.42490 Transcript_23152/m.42490 type:complete len:214 (+) Transcript_23152:566-1207(+)
MVQKPMLRIEVCAQIVKKRILLVDDSKSSLKLTRQEILSVLSLNNLEEEVEVDLATDGIDAVSKIDNLSTYGESYALVIVDIFMPRANGLDVAQFIRVHAYRGSLMPIVALTGTSNMAEWPSSCGADAVHSRYLSSLQDPSSVSPPSPSNMAAQENVSPAFASLAIDSEHQVSGIHHLDPAAIGSAVSLFDASLSKPITTSALAPLIAQWVLP